MNTQHARTHISDWTLGAAGAVATGLVAALVAGTVATSAASVPRDIRGHVADHGTRITTACHITPHTWNVAADGPMMRCYRYLP